MQFAAAMMHQDCEDEVCALEEKSVGKCPLCTYQDDNIIRHLCKTEKALQGNVEAEKVYGILVDMYKKHTEPLRRQGKQMLKLTVAHCREHYTKHVVNAFSQVSDDILYCSKMQRHYKKNIGVRNGQSGKVSLNPHHVQEYVKLSRHKLELVKYLNIMQKRKESGASEVQSAVTPHSFST